MEWVKSFYELQYDILGKLDDINFQEQRIEYLKKQKIQETKKILELGGGTGEFANLAVAHNYDVTMIELLESACIKAKAQYKKVPSNLNVICDDFYTIKYKEIFDAVCYWDGFGVGEDKDQKKLLKLVFDAMKPGALFFVDVYNPKYWSQLKNQKMDLGIGEREYNYDHEKNLMIDCWNIKGSENKKCQYLKCYSLSDFELLIKETGFEIVQVIASGYVDYNQNKYYNTNNFEKSMTNTFVLKK